MKGENSRVTELSFKRFRIIYDIEYMEKKPGIQEHLFHRDFGDIEKLAALGELLGGVVHELNSPISAILGCAEMLQSPTVSEKTKAQQAQTIHAAALRASKIIDGLLTLLRRQKADLVPIVANTVIRKTIPLFEYQFRTKQVSLILNLASGLPLVRADHGKIQQVLFNLLMNALQALDGWHEEKRIAITSFATEHSVRIIIEDSGPGIAPEHREQITTPFFTTKANGTGLGLSISLGIMKEHGGDLQITSGDRGCTAVLDLPFLAPAQEPFGAPHCAGKRILIVDDDEMVVDTFCALMEHIGYDITFATTAADALDRLEGESFDIIFVDYRLPKMDGMVFIASALPRIRSGTVAVIIDDDSFNHEDYCSRHGIAVLRKPFHLDDLRRFIIGTFEQT